MSHRPSPTASSGESASFRADSTADSILELDCVELVARIHDGSLRAEQVCATFLRQYEHQRLLNTVTWIDPPRVLERAREIDRARDRGARLPALAGLPILVKDNIDTVDFPTSVGTPSLKQHFPRNNAPVVDRLEQQGAIVMGKTNMDELAYGLTSSNPAFGFVHNPYDPDLISGGSSGGSAAAVAARIAPAALGTDAGGSVRMPAAFCGVVGLRPSIYPQQLYSKQGIAIGIDDLDTIGPMGRCVADVAMLHGAITNQHLLHSPSLEQVRIGVPKLAYWDDLHPEVERVAESALARLRDRGAVLVDIEMHEVKEAAWEIFMKLVSGAIVNLEDFLRTEVQSVSLNDLIEQLASRNAHAFIKKVRGSGLAADRAHARGAGREALCAAYRAVFERHGIQAMVFPTEVLPAPPIRPEGDDLDEMIEHNGRLVPKNYTIGRNTWPACALGTPGLSVPAGLTSKGLPVALEFDGLPGDDSALLALGKAAEAAIGRVPAPPHVFRHQLHGDEASASPVRGEPMRRHDA